MLVAPLVAPWTRAAGRGAIGGQDWGGGAAMRIVLNLVGVVLASAFLLYMAVHLNELPLYVVCVGGILMILAAFWQDEVQDESGKAARRGGGR